MVQAICQKCSKKFFTQQCYINRGGGKFCSPQCSWCPRLVCKVAQCTSRVKGQGYCGKHYSRIRNHGTIDIPNSGQSRPGEKNGMYGTHRTGKENPFYGKKHTEKAKEKNRKVHLGKKQTKESIEKMRAKLLGCIPTWLIGKLLSEDHRAKLRQSVPRGENSPHWKGGITPINKAIHVSPQFKRWALAVKIRDNFTCQSCQKHGGQMHADHIKRFADFPSLRFDLLNGRTLCPDCHRNTPTYGRYEH